MDRIDRVARIERMTKTLERMITEIAKFAEEEGPGDRRTLLVRGALAGRRMVAHLEGAAGPDPVYREE